MAAAAFSNIKTDLIDRKLKNRRRLFKKEN